MLRRAARVARASRSALVIWRGPDWHAVHDAFTAVSWPWVAVAIGLNLLSVVARSISWDTVHRAVDRAAASELPARLLGVLRRPVRERRAAGPRRRARARRRAARGACPGRKGTTATLIGSVFAHRMFDLFPTITLVVWVLFAAKIPHWAYLTLGLAIGIGVVAVRGRGRARAPPAPRARRASGSIRQLLARARQGLAIMRNAGRRRMKAAAFQYVGWFCQLLRRLGGDARVPDQRAARRRRARARADERRDDLPALARQRRPRAGRGRDAARATTASPTRTASRSGSACRRSRRRSASASASSSSRARASRSRRSGTWRSAGRGHARGRDAGGA